MNKQYTYWAIGILAVVIIALLGYALNRQKAAQNNWQQSYQQGTPNSPASPDASTTPPSSTASAKKLSYGDAIKAYPYRFQFSKCMGTPATISVKKGSPVMLDNRDAVVHTIKAGTQSFRIAGYDYAVLYPEILGNLSVTCDGKNRVTLNVQK